MGQMKEKWEDERLEREQREEPYMNDTTSPEIGEQDKQMRNDGLITLGAPADVGLGVYRAIASVTGKLAEEGIGKTRKNDQQGYIFRGIDDVYNALSRPIADAGLCLLPRVLRREVTERQTQRGGALFYVVVDVEYDLVCAEDGSQHTVRVIGEAMDTGDKATNKAMSAAYKYMAMQVFCIPTEGDNDADSTTHAVAASLKESPKGMANPRDGMGLVDPIIAQDWADDMARAIETDDLEAVQRIHAQLNREQNVYTAAADLLTAKQRAEWKAMKGKA